MISKRLSSILSKNSTRMLFNLRVVRNFSADNLKNILNSEIEHEEKNYEPVSASDKKTFFNNSKFDFVEEENSAKMVLKKTQNGYDVQVIFSAKSPTPEEEGENKEQQGIFK